MADDEKAKKDDEKPKKDDEKVKKDKEKAKKNEEKAKRNEDAEQSKSKGDENGSEGTLRGGPSLSSKIARALLFTFLATFVTALLFADSIPNGLRVDFDLVASIKLAVIAGVIAAVLRALAGLLPLFADDHDKSKKKDD